jgi:hypothetical protein
VCDFWENEIYNVEPAEWDGSICKYFLNKGRVTEVPCVIGQPMWKLCTWHHHAPAEILDGRVSMIQQKADRSWKVRISTKYGTDDLKAEDLGKWVFLNKKEAEEALAELEATNET